MNELLIGLNYLIRFYDFKNNKQLFIGHEVNSKKWESLVVYDTSDMLEQPNSYEDFISIVEENALDIDDFGIDIFYIRGGN